MGDVFSYRHRMRRRFFPRRRSRGLSILAVALAAAIAIGSARDDLDAVLPGLLEIVGVGSGRDDPIPGYDTLRYAGPPTARAAPADARMQTADAVPAMASPGAAVLRGGDAGARYTICSHAGQRNCVVDGDTFRRDGRTIRLGDIDAPEVFSPKCASEKAQGDRATERLRDLLNDGAVETTSAGPRDKDRYGRDLRIVARDGKSLGETLVQEGLARRWDGPRRDWCK